MSGRGGMGEQWAVIGRVDLSEEVLPAKGYKCQEGPRARLSPATPLNRMTAQHPAPRPR